jgi:hypothetical protein
MAELSVKLKEHRHANYLSYNNKISSEDYKKISLVLQDLKNLGLPIEKAIKDFNLKKSDWDAVLGL